MRRLYLFVERSLVSIKGEEVSTVAVLKVELCVYVSMSSNCSRQRQKRSLTAVEIVSNTIQAACVLNSAIDRAAYCLQSNPYTQLADESQLAMFLYVLHLAVCKRCCMLLLCICMRVNCNKRNLSVYILWQPYQKPRPEFNFNFTVEHF